MGIMGCLMDHFTFALSVRRNEIESGKWLHASEGALIRTEMLEKTGSKLCDFAHAALGRPNHGT